jgi:F-type H+-transporting ATPase subunit gamma
LAGLRDIKRRITSVRKTQQITRAMRMVAAAKLRRAQDSVLAARPYSMRMARLLIEIAHAQRPIEHPLLASREKVQSAEVVVVTSDRGLAGGFNSNVLKHAQRVIAEQERKGRSVALTLVGRKAVDFFKRRRPGQVVQTYIGLGEIRYEHAVEIARRLAARYESGEVDEVILVVSEFVSPLSQQPRDVQILPVPKPAEGAAPTSEQPFESEPASAALLGALVPKALEVVLHRALLENQAGEHAARMAAMESATRNTEEMIASLTLQFNRARQAAITRELVEIITGAEAL